MSYADVWDDYFALAPFERQRVWGKDGLFVPPDWGQHWYPALEDHASALCPIVGWGSSLMQGYYASDFTPPGTSFFAKMVGDVQAAASDGGSGFQSLINVTGIGVAGATYLGTTGNWQNNIATSAPNETSKYATTTATLTFPAIRGTDLDIWHIEHTSAAQTFSYNIDAAGAQSVQIGSKAAIKVEKHTVSGQIAGAKSVVLSWVAGSPIISGITGRNATGVVAHNMGLAGRTSQAGITTTYQNNSYGLNAFEQSVKPFAPKLVVLDCGMEINDTVSAVSLDLMAGRFGWMMRQAQAATADGCDFLIIVPHPGTTVDSSTKWGAYMGAITGLARHFGAAVFDVGYAWRNWAYADGLGYWGDTGQSTGAAGDDGVHPSNAGFAAIADPPTQLLLAA
jgi:hypothetical protein